MPDIAFDAVFDILSSLAIIFFEEKKLAVFLGVKSSNTIISLLKKSLFLHSFGLLVLR